MTNEYDALISDDQRSALRQSVLPAVGTNADEYAEAKRIEGSTGIPAPVSARNMPEASRQAKLNEYDVLIGTPVGNFLTKDPEHARLAHDDTAALAKVGKTVGATGSWASGASGDSHDSIGPSQPPERTLKNLAGGIVSGFTTSAEQTRQGVRRAFADAIGSAEMASDAAKKNKQTEFKNFLATPKHEGWLEGDIYGGLISTAQSLPAVALTVASIPIGLAVMGLQAGSPAYSKYRDRNATGGEATAGAALEGAAEILGELLPMSFLVKNIGRIGAGQFIRGLLGREIPSEIATTIAQTATDTAIANPEKTWAEWVQELPAEIRSTVVATIVQGGVMTGIGAGMRYANLREQQADVADNNAEGLKQLLADSAATLLRERSPETFTKFIAGIDGPVDAVYVDAVTFMQEAQKAGIDLTKMPETSAVLDDAVATNSDVRIPLSEFASVVPGTAMEQSIIPHLKTDPDGATQEEIKDKAWVEETKKTTQRILDAHDFTDQWKASAAVVKNELLTQLSQANRFTRDVNEAYASFMSAFYATQAQKLGITPEQMYVKYPLQIRAQSVAGDNVLSQSVNIRPQQPEAVSVEGVHFSTTPGLSVLQGSRSGTNANVRGAEQPRVRQSQDPRIKQRVNFYVVEGDVGAKRENGVGPHPYRVTLTNMYPFDTDPRGIGGRVKGIADTATRQNALESAVIDEGFDGYFVNGQAVVLGGNVVIAYNQDPVSREWYYSELAKRIDDAPMKEAPAQAWKDYIRGLKGVKQMEIEATGVNEWLDIANPVSWAVADAKGDRYIGILSEAGAQKLADASPTAAYIEQRSFGKVTKADVQTFLREHGVRVDTNILSGMTSEEPEYSISDSEVDDPDESYLKERAEESDDYKEALEEARKEKGGQFLSKREQEAILDKFIEQERSNHYNNDEAPQSATATLAYEGRSYAFQVHYEYGEVEIYYPAGRSDSERIVTEGFVRHGRDGVDVEAEIRRHAMEHLDVYQHEGEVQYGDYQLPGSEADSYFELLLSLPGKRLFDAPHFGAEGRNLLAHVRANTRYVPGGHVVAGKTLPKKELFIEEIQSDWAQAGREEGFAGSLFDTTGWTTEAPTLGNRMWQVYNARGDFMRGVLPAATAEEAIRKAASDEGRIARAPFVTKTDAWVALVWKRLIRYAAENGYDSIAWTRGDQQVERWQGALRKRVDYIEWVKTAEGVHLLGFKGARSASDVELEQLRAEQRIALRNADAITESPDYDENNSVMRDAATTLMTEAQRLQALINDLSSKGRQTKVVDTTYKEDQLSDAIGKAMGRQILSNPAEQGVIEGQNITIDDIGMSQSYGDAAGLKGDGTPAILTKVANEVLKKFGGGKVGAAPYGASISSRYGGEVFLYDNLSVAPTKEKPQWEYFVTRHADGEVVAGPFKDAKERDRLRDRMEGTSELAPGFDITADLKAKALGGFPLFQGTRGQITFGTDIKDTPSVITLLANADLSTFLHESGHFYLEVLADMASQPDAPADVVADFNTVLQWFGIKGDEPTTGATGGELAQYARVTKRSPAIGRFLNNLTPFEQHKVTDAVAGRILEHLKTIPSANEMAAIAHAGREKKGWYSGSARIISAVFGPDAPRFAALLSAMSPQTSVESNLRNTLNTWKNWLAAGRPTDRQKIIDVLAASVEGQGSRNSVFNAWINNAERALSNEDVLNVTLSGPKVESFYRNLIGEVEAVTLDSWMASYALVNNTIFYGTLTKGGDAGKSSGYLAFSARVREAAKKISAYTGEEWTPAEVQETVWSWSKALYELASRESATAVESLEAGKLTRALLSATPDFNALFNEDEFKQILMEAGYGDELEQIAGRTAERQPGEDSRVDVETGPFDPETQQRYERAVARRLDKLREQRTLDQSPVDRRHDFAGRVDRSLALAEEAKALAKELGAQVLRAQSTGADTTVLSAEWKAAREAVGKHTFDALKTRADLEAHRAGFGQGGDEGAPGPLPAGRTPLEVWQNMSMEQRRPYHEKWARGMEAYLFEGKAPSLELQPLFGRFRAWLLNVYQQLVNLRVTLTPEVRQVMSRLLATNEEILRTEDTRAYTPLFQTKPPGMSDVEWVEYQQLPGDATQNAVDQLQTRSLRDMQYASNAKAAVLKTLQRQASDKRSGVRAEVQSEVYAEPIYQAMHFLKTGKMTDENGEQIQVDKGAKLDNAALAEMYPPTALANPDLTRLAGMTRTEGLHPNLVAEMFGFGSGDELVRKLADAESPRDKINGITDQRMLERYGDLSDPDSMERAANAAVHNDVRGRFVATELRTLDKAVGKRKVLIAAAKDYAATLIARKKVRDIRPNVYVAAETRAGKAAERAVLAGDTVLAATEKRNQLVNLYAAKSANDALDEVDKGVALLKRAGESSTIDPSYREQIAALLERFDLRKVTGKEAERRTSLIQWIEKQREQNMEPVIDPMLENEATRKPYQDLTLEEFRGLVDSVRNIEHLGRLKHRLLNAADQRAFDVIVKEAADSINANAARTLTTKLERDKTWLGRASKGIKEFFVMHLKMSSMAREMDGWSDSGVLQRLLIHTMNNAGAREATLHEQATVALSKLMAPVINTGKLSTKMLVPGTNISLSREGRIVTALHMGNDGNYQRLLDGDHWTPVQAQAVLDTLTKPEMDFVQSVWDFIGTYRAEVGAQQKRITGLEPDWVAPRAVVTRHGLYAGGYFPAKYDTARNTRALSDEAAANLIDAWRAKRGAAQTRASFTKERADKVLDRPLLKELTVLTRHVTEVTHRLAWQDWVMDTSRLLRAKPIDAAIREHYGPEVLESMRNAVEDIAAGNIPAQNVMESAANYVRSGAVIAGLGWNLSTALLQPFGLAQSMSRIGVKWVGRGLAEWLGDAAHMENTAKRIYDKSEMMRLRGKTMQREISEILDIVENRSSALTVSYFYLIQKLQLVADIPTWLGQYQKAVAGGADEAQAVAQADQAVKDAQGGGQIHDQAAIMRGGAFLKLFTTFATFFNSTFNVGREAVGRTNFKSATSIAMLAVDFLLLVSVPAALGTLMKWALSDDDDEDKLVRSLIADQVSYLFGTMVGLREAAGGVRVALDLPGDYTGPASLRLFSELTKLGKQAGQGEVDEAFLKALFNTGGILFHLPTGQLTKTADGVVALTDGRTDNPGVLVVGSSKP